MSNQNYEPSDAKCSNLENESIYIGVRLLILDNLQEVLCDDAWRDEQRSDRTKATRTQGTPRHPSCPCGVNRFVNGVISRFVCGVISGDRKTSHS